MVMERLFLFSLSHNLKIGNCDFYLAVLTAPSRWYVMIYMTHLHLRPYEKLIAWQEAHKLYLWIHDRTEKFPEHERKRLVDQMRRSAYSAPMNLAEGCNKRTMKERRRYYEIAASSLEELHYQCRLSRDLKYFSQEDFLHVEAHISRTSYLINRLRGVI